MGPEGNILVNSPITTFQQSLTHSAMGLQKISKVKWKGFHDAQDTNIQKQLQNYFFKR